MLDGGFDPVLAVQIDGQTTLVKERAVTERCARGKGEIGVAFQEQRMGIVVAEAVERALPPVGARVGGNDDCSSSTAKLPGGLSQVAASNGFDIIVFPFGMWGAMRMLDHGLIARPDHFAGFSPCLRYLRIGAGRMPAVFIMHR